MMPFAVMDGGNAGESPSYSIDLSDLFPFLKVHSLPLYMMDEPVTIELTLHPPVNNRAVLITGTGSQTFAVDQNELKFCADYVYYNGVGDEMERFKSANKDMSFSFVDYRLIETSVSQSNLSSGVIRNLGMANRMVPRIISALADTALRNRCFN